MPEDAVLTPKSQFHRVNRIVPTVQNLLEIMPPALVDGIPQDPMDGASTVASLTDPGAPENKHAQYFEVTGSRACCQNGWIGWMASVFGPGILCPPGVDPAIFDWSPESDTWELCNLTRDFSQGRDLAAEEPERFAAMVEGINSTAEEHKAFPIGGGLSSPHSTPNTARATWRRNSPIRRMSMNCWSSTRRSSAPPACW